ncbi:carcinoembryonic antigen-related cell adhesion molecule 5-like [Brachionichthys hirsutus]|uniref:carcinoembryonic antigen-related cell adhesion molecule 5-like n=1 Tax=Brachionichthys hirsutus TaxID=412623 RepID=UPI0036052FBF
MYMDVFPSEKVEFICSITGSSHWTFSWSRDGQEVQDSDPNVSLSAEGSMLKLTAATPTYSGSYNYPPKPSLRLLTPWTDVFENETVGFSCDVESSDWTVTWYLDEVEVSEDDSLMINPEESSLNITAITEAYQGTYVCRAQLESRSVVMPSNTLGIAVYENVPKPTVTVAPGINPMYFGETVNFTCNVDVASGWTYQWYKDGEWLPQSSKANSVHLGPSTGGGYACSATRGEVTSTEISEEIRQDAIEIPVPSLKAMEQWLDVFPGESVRLSCGMDKGPDWIYTWYRDGEMIQAINAMYFSLNGPTLTIKSASAEHAGQYSCKGDLRDRSVSSSFSLGRGLTVYDSKPTVTLIQDPDYKLMFLGESVAFICHIDVSSGWEYLWYKDGEALSISGNKYRYVITSVGTTNQGSYKCQARRGTNQDIFLATSQAKYLEVQENKPKPSIAQQPDVDQVYVGESVTMNCKVQLSSGWEYVWRKDGTQLLTNSSKISIDAAYSTDSGTYECMARRNKNIYNTTTSDGRILYISEIPVPSIMPLTQWMDVFPTESVEMHCGMSSISEWTYTWYKDGQKVQASEAVSFDLDATTLSIHAASAFHLGKYSCSGKLKSRSVTSDFSPGLLLDVYGSKPRVTLVQEPSHNVMHTGDSMSFSCHINISSGWEYLWYKDDSPLAESGDNHTITSLLTKDSGSYICKTKRGRSTLFQSQTVRLDIEERPQADVVLMTGWSEAFSTDSLVLKCHVPEGQYSWNYTWFKEDRPMDLPPSEKYTVTPQNDPDQSLYTCQGNRHGRPSYSKTSEQFKTKNLLLKRRVLLSISGCIFFGIIVVFIGCIFLRVIRKPAKREFKPEEAELFLSMDQIKGLDDPPCPLFQFITDAELNSSSQEGEENGLTDNATTPLPIATQEDQAQTTESHGATENGGLVSFKQ